MNGEPVDFLSISDAAKVKLKDAGAVLVQNVLGDRVSFEAIPTSEHRDDEIYLKQLKTPIPVISCFDLLQKQGERLKSGSEKLDELLDGGFKPGSLTEISGLPGSGKTQFCLQLCAVCQRPENFGGRPGQALFVDLNFGFSKSRYEGIRKYFIDQEKELDPIILRISTTNQLLAAIESFPDILLNNDKIRLIIIDSFSRPFMFDQVSSTLMSGIMMDLHSVAEDFDLVIILTSQLITNLSSDQEEAIKHQPALRSGYLYYINERIMFYGSHEKREIIFPDKLDGVAAIYEISNSGFVLK
ncbi:DNA repair protein RAD51 homolog 3 [Neocloeon triangulifer]|uniref:DNA repair protein RAD51 homolog 3 n=1 Tax=Neocloeon triangulifer TaxID=2078957 RepID=UPI00286F4BF8|nr:DNA repair protein RAD51 homolog 3 [Neocloeon triangulifer]